VTPLQAPSQAAPSGVAVTASSVSSPNSAPNVPTTTASSVSSPSVVSSVSSPSSSSAVSSVSSVTPPVSSVKPVGVTVKPLGRYNPVTGKCENAAWVSEECDTDKDLKAEANSLEDQVKSNSGDIGAHRTRLREIELQQELRNRLGTDKKADDVLKNITKSEMYSHDMRTYTSLGRLKFLDNLLASIRRGDLGNKDLESLGKFMSVYRFGVDDAGRVYFYYANPQMHSYESPGFGEPQEIWESQLAMGSGSQSVFFNSNQETMSSIFGNGGSQGNVFGFLVGALNGYKDSSGRVADGFSMSDFRKYRSVNSRVFSTRAKNPCDIGLSRPPTFDDDKKPFTFSVFINTVRDFRSQMYGLQILPHVAVAAVAELVGNRKVLILRSSTKLAIIRIMAI
jgi:hypothetical protein